MVRETVTIFEFKTKVVYQKQRQHSENKEGTEIINKMFTLTNQFEKVLIFSIVKKIFLFLAVSMVGFNFSHPLSPVFCLFL